MADSVYDIMEDSKPASRAAARSGVKMRRLLHYEKLSQPLAPPSHFRSRLAWNVLAGALIIAAALAIGMAGYHWIAGHGRPWMRFSIRR